MIICLVMLWVICIECSSFGLLISVMVGLDMIVILVIICCCRFLVFGEFVLSVVFILNSVEGLVLVRVIIVLCSCGLVRLVL